MTRSADYSIEGFLYQFHKTLLEVLRAANDAEIIVEGVIEDIEIHNKTGIKAIQCKYHDTQPDFVESKVYKPLLQMMQHFQENPTLDITYILFAHFLKSPDSDSISESTLKNALKSEDSTLQKYIKKLKDNVDTARFFDRFTFQPGPSFDTIALETVNELKKCKELVADVETVSYPNAIQLVARLSIQHDAALRRISRKALLADLSQIEKIAITRWTLSLRSKKQILNARRNQLKPSLAKNIRRRCLIFNCRDFADPVTSIVDLAGEFVAKYHFKPAHMHVPVLCIDGSQDEFQQSEFRLHKKEIEVNTGIVGNIFDQKHFYRDPMIDRSKAQSVARREFSLRMLHWGTNGAALRGQRFDDLIIIGKDDYDTLDRQDISVESLETNEINEIKYLLHINTHYE